jgi:hypothetical protein
MTIFDKNGGCVAIDLRPEAHTPHYTYVSLPYITLFDFWWRPFLGKKSVGVSFWYYWKWSFMAIFDKNGGCVAIYHWPEAQTPHPDMFPCHRSHSWISGGDHFLVKNSYVLAFGIIENGRSWLFSKNGGCVAIDNRPEARTPHPTYVSLP